MKTWQQNRKMNGGTYKCDYRPYSSPFCTSIWCRCRLLQFGCSFLQFALWLRLWRCTARPPHRYGQSSSQIPQFPTWPSTGTVYTPHTPEQQKNLITISYVFIYWAIKTRSQNLIITPLHRTMRMRIHTYSYYIFIPCFQETNKSLIDFLL